jgi:alkaline phosphatase D
MNKYTYLFIFSLIFVGLTQAQELRSTLKAGQAPFFHGVASGDPLSDRVMLWTKITPPSGNLDSIPVYWQIASDVNFTNVVNFGNTLALASSDFTVKLDVCGLQGGTHYYYVFKALGQNSITGRTKTAPAAGGTDARFAVASCSSYEHGYFNAYESMAKRNDLDAIIHLGDYIYEYATGGYSSSIVTGFGRTYQPTNEIITLSEYRIRHSHYKLDDQLQLLHQIHPFITTWDDHETANDAYKDGAQNHSSGSEGSWIDRKISGAQAYKEYMPIRNPDPNDDIKIWRSLRYGNLLDLIVLDSRLWARDEQNLGQTNSNNRNLLGNDQFTWLENRLSDNTTQWKIICQQVMMAPLEILGAAVNADQWDGYNKDRNRLINYIEGNNIQNPVVLTGDIHTSWINNVPGNATTTAAVEFVVTSVTSPGLDVIEVALGQLPQFLLNAFGGLATGVITGLNPHMQHVNLEDHGYMVFTVNQNRAQGDFVYLEREVIDTTNEAGVSYFTNTGVSNMIQAANAIPPILGGAPVPPRNANQNLPFALLLDTFQLSITEAQFSSICLINVSNACPNINTSIIANPSFGTANINQFCIDYQGIPNYYGQDYFTTVFCQTANPSDCDTVVVALNVQATSNMDTIVYQITSDSTLNECISFNDLVASPGAVTTNVISTGTFTIDSNYCFSYVPDITFNGTHYIGLITCDSLNICDTLVLQMQVSSMNTTTFVELFGEQGELLSNCLSFDDLQGTITSSGIINNGSNNALIFGDSCLSYISQANFSGTDTITLYACDNSVPPICDTVVYWIQIDNDTVTDTTSISDVLNTDFAVIGVYPNPFDVEILVQYYQFSNQPISINLFDITGKQLFSENMGETSEGLKYARLETSSLPVGNYIIELSSEANTYTKKLVKF